MASEPSAAFSSGTSTAAGSNMPTDAASASTTRQAPTGMDVDEGDTNMPPDQSVRFSNLNASSMHIAEMELACKDAINTRLSQSHRIPAQVRKNNEKL